MAALCNVLRAFDQAASARPSLRDRRYAMKLTPAKPRIIMAQVEGSGTAPGTLIVKASRPQNSPLTLLIVRLVNSLVSVKPKYCAPPFLLVTGLNVVGNRPSLRAEIGR